MCEITEVRVADLKHLLTLHQWIQRTLCCKSSQRRRNYL